jgi:enoyl-CoA hydratase/carnithine racemase
MAQATYEQIKYEVQDNILTITLNRPDKMNAFTHVMMDELISAFDAADADDNVRAIIVTGAGRAFCAGADLSEAARHSIAPHVQTAKARRCARTAKSNGATTQCATAAAA